MDILHTLYSRSRLSDDDFKDLVWPLFSPDIIELLRRLYEWSIVDPTNIDEEKYLLSKKFAEVQSKLSPTCRCLTHVDADDFQHWWFD